MHNSGSFTLVYVVCFFIGFITCNGDGMHPLQVPSCRHLIAGCGADRCYYTVVGSTTIATCPRCLGILYKRSADGTRCDCRPGTYGMCSSGVCQCLRCPTGSWCSGGRITSESHISLPLAPYESAAVAVAIAVPCGQGLTTRPGVVARYSSQCVTLPGWGAVFRNASQVAPCAVGTYSRGGRSAGIPCTRCPSGFTTRFTAATQREDCVASPGLYVDMGLTKPCPAGHFQPNFTMGYMEVCLPCPTGVTTARAAATLASECAVALPGYGITTCGTGVACQAEVCAVGFYNPGGVGSSSCIRCPYGMTTQNNSSAGEALCLVPPGHGLVLPLPADTSINRVEPCVYGYNAGWNRAACTSCGVNVTSLNNRTSVSDCYVLRGQGLQMMRDAVLGTIRTALDCWVGSVGMAVDTPVRLARPCDTCPQFMTTLSTRSSNKSDCLALAGYAVQEVPDLDLTIAVPCQQGTYKGSLGNEPCTLCPSNTSTPNVGATAINQCTVCQAGWGGWSTTGGSPAGPSCSVRCPIGSWNDGNYATCQMCPGNTTTLITQAISADNCTVCLPGWGGWNATGPTCSTRCSSNTFNNGSFATCQPCPSGFVPTSDASSCVPAPSPSPPVSTCTQRPPSIAPTTSATLPTCPTGNGGGGAFDAWQPGATGNAPPGCVRRGGGSNCNPGQGQLVNGLSLEPLVVNGVTRCVCPNWRQGFVLQRLPNGRLGCVATLTFLPEDPTNIDGAGAWVTTDSLPTILSCSNSQECWDMCFFCDGSQRFSNQQSSASRLGIGRIADITGPCTSTSCPFLGSPATRTQAFNTTCIAFAQNAAPHFNPGLALVNGVYPYRPAPVSTALVLPAALPNNLAVNRGQRVMLSFQLL